MIESEFRDWTRGQLRVLDERIKAVAALKSQPAKPQVEKRIHDDIVSLGQKLVELAKAGKVLGAAIVYVTDDDRTMTGYSADGGFFRLAGGAQFIGLEILEDFRKSEVANDQAADRDGAGASGVRSGTAD